MSPPPIRQPGRSPLRLALIAGGMYDALYESLPAFEQLSGFQIEVPFRGDHVALNRELAREGAASRFDIVSTHSKYAPSQLGVLSPLDPLLGEADLDDFQPALLDLARVQGRLLGLPRNLDARLLHYRTDLIPEPPETWEDLLALAAKLRRPDCDGFVFPGMESGLFGTFFELAEMGGARLFPEAGGTVDPHHPGARWALQLLRALYQSGAVPADLTGWHYDAVHAHFRAGRSAMVGDWPGYYASYSGADSPVAGRFAVFAYPRGPGGRSLSYGGSHTFALTPAGADRPEALALLRFLTSPDNQLDEARAGSVPVRHSVMRMILEEAAGDARRRWEVLDQVIREGLLIPPKFARYPELEEALWRTVQQAMTGALPIGDALERIAAELQAASAA